MTNKMPSEGLRTGVSRYDLTLPVATEWTEVGQVEKIFVYPLKSAKGRVVGSAQVTKHGLKSGPLIDRQLVIVDAGTGNIVTARKFPKLLLIDVDVADDGTVVTLAGPGVESLDIDIPKDFRSLEKVNTNVWGKKCAGFRLGQEADDWITNYIQFHHGSVDSSGEELKFNLLFQPFEGGNNEGNREKHPDFDPLAPFTRPDDVPIFADDYPANLQTLASLGALNERLKTRNIPMTLSDRHYRSNFVISGNFPPFAEDAWAYIKINDVILRNARLCARCLLTTINVETGEKDQGPMQ